MAKTSTGDGRGRSLLRALIAAGAACVAVEGTAFAQITATLTVTPPVVLAGEPAAATYVVRNEGDGDFVVPLVLSLIDPDTGDVLFSANDTAILPPGGVYPNVKTIPTAGLGPKTYIVGLDMNLEGTQRLATATLQVVAPTLDCTTAGPSADELWPPNHKFRGVSVIGVTDASGNPANVVITEVFQDEPTNDVGDGNTCPDATGMGSGEVRVRAERSGTLDGRIYHLRFTASDPSGGSCVGEVTVCVPHDQGHKPQCVDQGPLFNSGVCSPARVPKALR
jgi:hypothetical protein